MKPSRCLTLAFALVALTLAGCGDPSQAEPAAVTVSPLHPSWTLDAVGAWRVPVSVGAGANVSRVIRAGSLTLRADWSWEIQYDYRDLGATVDRQGTRTLSGSYAARDVDPSSLTVHDDATGATYPATVNADNTVDLTLDGLRYHFTAAQ
jgi:hypothetical protein